MPISKNNPRYLSLDKDERLLTAEEMRDALNVRNLSSQAADVGALENVLGTNQIETFLTGDTYECIGTVAHQELNDLYFFFWSTSADNNAIVKYNSITGAVETVLQNSVLRFNRKKYIQGVAITSANDGATLLYWTDGYNPPRKINVSKAILHTEGDFVAGYPQELSTGTYEERQAYIDHIRYQPANAPTFSFGSDTTIERNDLRDTMYQFRYRYLYDDGEYSAYSIASKVAYTDNQSQNNSYARPNDSSIDNYLNVTVSNSNETVETIEIIARNGNLGEWKKIKTIDNDPNKNTTSFRFYNDGNYEVADNLETNKLFDAVPLVAKTEDIVSDRFCFGNTVDGYDVPQLGAGGGFRNVSGQTIYSVSPSYNSRPDYEQFNNQIVVTGGRISTPTGFNVTDNSIGVTFLNAPAPSADLTYLVSFTYTATVTARNFFGTIIYKKNFNSTFTVQYTAQGGDTLQDVIDNMANALKGIVSSGVTVSNTNAGAAGFGVTLNYKVPTGSNISSRRYESSIDFVSFVCAGGNGTGSFKAGAKHPFGIVYSDRAGRVSTVSKLSNGEPYVKWFAERANEPERANELLGDVDMHIRLSGEPPKWATHWQIVYAGNSSDSREALLEYGTLKAFKQINGANSASNRRVYVNLSLFKGKDYSYREQNGAVIDYEFVQGDRLKIRTYYDYELGKRVEASETLDFKIVGYEFLEQDVDVNPVYNPNNKDETTGWFLILEDPSVDGWTIDNVSSQTENYWFFDNGTNSESQGAVFQIYRPQATTENDVYYEISEKYPILDAGEDNARYGGSLRDQGQEFTYSISQVSNSAVYIDTSGDIPRLVVGDYVKLEDSGIVKYALIKSIGYDNNEESYFFYTESNISNITEGDATLFIKTAAVIIENGDVWMKPRIMYNGSGILSNSFLSLVEDYYLNDFFNSNNWDRGRANAFVPNDKQRIRKATIWISEPFNIDTIDNGFSSFNLSLAPYKELNRKYGAVQRIRTRDNYLVVYQEDKVSNVPVGRNIIESSDGGQALTLSSNVFGEQNFYVGDYGISNNPESFAEYNGKHYFIDIKRGKAMRLANDGLTPISEYGMNSFFDDRQRELLSIQNDVKIVGGFDREYEEYVLNFPSVSNSQITVTSADVDYDVNVSIPNLSSDANNIYINSSIQVVPNPPQIVWGNENRTWENMCDNWEDSGYVLVKISDYVQSNIVYIGNNVFGTGSTSYFCLVQFPTSQGETFYAEGTINVISGQITIPKTQTCAAFTLSDATDETTDGHTIAFYEPFNKWTTFYSYQPDFFGSVSSRFFTASNADIWEHNRSATRNNFYGTQYNSRIEFYFNEFDSAVKKFRALSLEGNAPWEVTQLETNLNSASMSSADFTEKEGFWYQSIPFATTGSTDGNRAGIGTISAINGNTVTIRGFDIAGSGLFVGDSIYDGGGNLIGTIASFPARNQITLSSVAGLNVGDYILVIKPAATHGDRIRGYYMKCTMENQLATAMELYAINTEWNNSYYAHVE